MGNHFGEYGVSWMPKRAARPGPPAVGQRVYLGGYITGVGEDTSGFQSVIIKLDKFESPITIYWSDEDGDSIATPYQLGLV